MVKGGWVLGLRDFLAVLKNVHLIIIQGLLEIL